jgi:paraquat-inducible protein A
MRKRSSDSFQSCCAFGMAGILFLILANIYPIMNFSVAGNTQANEIITGVGVLIAQGYGLIAVLVFFCAMLAPAIYFSGVTYVSLACMAPTRVPLALPILKLVRQAQPWSLVPVFAAACMVSAVLHTRCLINKDTLLKVLSSLARGYCSFLCPAT